MSGTSAQERGATDLTRQAKALAEKGYGIGLPVLRDQLALVERGLATGGEPAYVKSAFAQQRTGVAEGIAEQTAAEESARRAGMGVGKGIGTLGAAVPPSYGARLASALMGSRTNEAMSSLDEMNTLLNFGLGGSSAGASGALQAGGAQLNALGLVPNYNRNLANILGAISLGGSIYGAGSQAGWWGSGGGGTAGAGMSMMGGRAI